MYLLSLTSQKYSTPNKNIQHSWHKILVFQLRSTLVHCQREKQLHTNASAGPVHYLSHRVGQIILLAAKAVAYYCLRARSRSHVRSCLFYF